MTGLWRVRPAKWQYFSSVKHPLVRVVHGRTPLPVRTKNGCYTETPAPWVYTLTKGVYIFTLIRGVLSSTSRSPVSPKVVFVTRVETNPSKVWFSFDGLDIHITFHLEVPSHSSLLCDPERITSRDDYFDTFQRHITRNVGVEPEVRLRLSPSSTPACSTEKTPTPGNQREK